MKKLLSNYQIVEIVAVITLVVLGVIFVTSEFFLCYFFGAGFFVAAIQLLIDALEDDD